MWAGRSVNQRLGSAINACGGSEGGTAMLTGHRQRRTLRARRSAVLLVTCVLAAGALVVGAILMTTAAGGAGGHLMHLTGRAGRRAPERAVVTDDFASGSGSQVRSGRSRAVSRAAGLSAASGGCVGGPVCAAAAGPTGGTGALGSSAAQERAFVVLGRVARCYAGKQRAVRCAGPGVAGVPRVGYGAGPGEVFVLAPHGSPGHRSYVVTSVSGTGEVFSIDHDAVGQVVRMCSPAGVAGCSKEGTW